MPVDASLLPEALVPFADAMEVVKTQNRYATGYQAYGFPEAPHHPFIEGQPPYDGIYRATFSSTTLCVRLDLQHPTVSEELREQLKRDFSDQIGGDQAFYEYVVDERVSQLTNRARVIANVARKVESRRGE